MSKVVMTDLIKQILPANEKNLPFYALSLALNLFNIGSQNCFFLGLPPTSNPRYLNGILIYVQFKVFV